MSTNPEKFARWQYSWTSDIYAVSVEFITMRHWVEGRGQSLFSTTAAFAVVELSLIHI